MNEKTINDIYTGRPDAKDEIKFDGIEGFVNSIVIPDTFNINNLLNKNHCFITGYKGTGKTALLFYLEFLLKEKTPYACFQLYHFKMLKSFFNSIKFMFRAFRLAIFTGWLIKVFTFYYAAFLFNLCNVQ